MKKNKWYLILILSIFFIGIGKANASDTYFVSANGVALTEKEYNFMVEMYDEYYVNNLRQDQFDRLNNFDMNNDDITIETYIEENPFTRGVSYETASKRISLGKTCTSNTCTMIATLKWLASPNVRSYDNMGARFTGSVSLYDNDITTVVEAGSTSTYCTNYRILSNGFGCSFKLNSSASSFYISQVFQVSGSGYVYSSYQHAIDSVSLTTAKKYNIALAGYGNVFDFYGDAVGMYDGMSGVNLSV